MKRVRGQPFASSWVKVSALVEIGSGLVPVLFGSRLHLLVGTGLGEIG